ncbi:hypothetical protein P4261_28055 [Bacillus thuringiensis]|nr:hypothetical protein [Bacillus thuringiensis]MED2829736.1 hypothetical protein [Bacillus thuringiensis]MED2856403.1 hypothetical protein [Bacillus thuringiensis]MED2863792.1 hypothetical protein [Bacillus thuringiensis]
MNITVKETPEQLKINSGDIVALRRNGLVNTQYYVVTGSDYLINIRCGSHRHKDNQHNGKKALLRMIVEDPNATLIQIFNKDEWELNLIEKGTK